MFNMWVDGSVRGGNPGFGGIGVLVKHDGVPCARFSKIIGDDMTNNEAEYKALIIAIEYIKRANAGKEKCIITIDSDLVFGHVIKGWNCNFDHLRILRDRVKTLIKELPFTLELCCVDRFDNELANELAQAITEKEKMVRRGNAL